MMNRYLLALATACGLIATMPVLAADWKSYGEGLYYDDSSLVKNGNKIRVWIRNFEEGGKNGVPAVVPKRTNKNLFIIDCKAKTYNIQAAYTKYQNGITQDTIHEFPDAGRDIFIVPDSGLESLANTICKSKWWPF